MQSRRVLGQSSSVVHPADDIRVPDASPCTRPTQLELVGAHAHSDIFLGGELISRNTYLLVACITTVPVSCFSLSVICQASMYIALGRSRTAITTCSEFSAMDELETLLQCMDRRTPRRSRSPQTRLHNSCSAPVCKCRKGCQDSGVTRLTGGPPPPRQC